MAAKKTVSATKKTPQQLMAEVQAKMGKRSIMLGNDPSLTVRKVSTGMLPIDILLDGGIPYGRMVELVGDWCIAPDSLVLTTDLEWVRADTLEPGFDLVGFEEDLNQGRGRSSKFEPATIERVASKRLECYRIITDKGTTVVSSNHQFVVRARSGSSREWRAAEDIRAGDSMVWFGAPWSTRDTYAAGYLSGIFDGEGWLDGSRVCVGQLPGAVFNLTTRYLEDEGYDITEPKAADNGVLSVRIKGGFYDSLRFLGEHRPQRLLNNSGKLWIGKTMTSKGPSAQVGRTETQVISVERLGEQDVIAFSTSTGTFISDGFLSHNSTLKSVIGYSTAAQVQAEGGTAALIDTEHAYEPEWAERLGIDTKSLMVWPDRDDDDEHTGEEALDVAQVLTAGGADLIVFDSVAAAYPQDEAGKPMANEKVQPGRLAQMMSKGLRRLTAANNQTAFIFVNQTRMNIGVTFGSPETTTGGKALPYYASMRVAIRKVGKTTRNVKVWQGEKWVDTKEQTGQLYKAELQKSKLSKPFKEVWFTWSYETGQIDTPGFLIAQGLELGLITVKGKSWTYKNKKVVGREKFKTVLSADLDLLEELECQVRESHGLPVTRKTEARPAGRAKPRGSESPAPKKVLRKRSK